MIRERILHYFNASSDTTKLPGPRGHRRPTQKWSEQSKPKRVLIDKKEATMRVFSWFQIGKYAAENGVAETMCFNAKKFILKESSVRTWKNVSFWAGARMR